MPSAATGDLSVGNYQAVADDVAHTLLDSASSGQTLDNLLPLSADSSGARSSTSSLLDIEAFAARLFVRQQRHEQALATQTETWPCDTGQFVITVDYLDQQTISAGDSVTVSSEQCVIAGEPVTGGIRMELREYTETISGIDARFEVTHHDFGTSALRVDGAASLRLTSDAQGQIMSVQYLGMTSTEGSVQRRWYHGVTISIHANPFSTQLSFGGFHLGANGYYQLQQLQPFDMSLGGPANGVVRVVDAQGDRVMLVLVGNLFRYEFYAAGNPGNVPDAAADGLAFVN